MAEGISGGIESTCYWVSFNKVPFLCKNKFK